MNPNNKGIPVFYPEDEPRYLRRGQIEIKYISAPAGSGLRVLIKTYIQTDEEAGGVGDMRKMNLSYCEGDVYYHNGVQGTYQNVGHCEKAPREFAVRTVLFKSQSEILDAIGDWDYEVLAQKTMHDNLELVTDMNGNKVNLRDMRKGYSPDHMTYVFDEIDEVTISKEGVTRVRCKRTADDRPFPRKLEAFCLQGTTTGRSSSDKPNVSGIPQSFYPE